MHQSPEIRRARTAPRESRRSHRNLAKIAGTSILLAAGMGSVFGQQQCTSTEVKRVFASPAAVPPVPSDSVPTDTALPPKSKRETSSARKRSKVASPPITAITVPRDQDVYYELERCEEEWAEDELPIWTDCRTYACGPKCTEQSPNYVCTVDLGGKVFLSLDLDDDAVTVSWSDKILSGPMIKFPGPDFCNDLAQQEIDRQAALEDADDYLAQFSKVPPMRTSDGRLKFSLKDNPCTASSMPDFRLIIDASLTGALLIEDDGDFTFTQSFEAFSPQQFGERLRSFLEYEQGFNGDPCR